MLKQFESETRDHNKGRRPFIGGSEIDPASAPGLPNAGLMPKEGNPPDASKNKDDTRGITGNTQAVQQIIFNALEANIPQADLTPKINGPVQGTGGDTYVSAYTGYLAVWYNAATPTCLAGWHTHVGFLMTLATATKAMKIQIDELITWLDEIIN